MTLSETYMMLTFFVALLALLVQVAGTAFDIAWKISQDERHKSDNKKKRVTAHGSQPVVISLFASDCQ